MKVSENVDLMEAIPTDVPEIRTGSSEGFNEELNKIIYSLNIPNEVDQGKLNIKHEIILKENAQGVYTRPYRRSMGENEIITQEVMNLKEDGSVRDSTSEFAYPVVLVKKRWINQVLCRLSKVKCSNSCQATPNSKYE